MRKNAHEKSGMRNPARREGGMIYHTPFLPIPAYHSPYQKSSKALLDFCLAGFLHLMIA